MLSLPQRGSAFNRHRRPGPLRVDFVEKGGSNPMYWRQPPKQSKGSAGS